MRTDISEADVFSGNTELHRKRDGGDDETHKFDLPELRGTASDRS